MPHDWLRAHLCAERFGVSRQMLARWADEGKVARSRMGRMTFYAANDIRAVLDAGAVKTKSAPAQRDTWREHPLFRGRRAS